MTSELVAVVDKIWQSADRMEAARVSSVTLSPDAISHLKEIFRSLGERATARKLLESKTSRTLSPNENQTTKDSWNAQTALVLLTLALYQSDSLALLPPEMGRSRIASWVEDTGYPISIVMEAILLGPAGLQPMLAE